MEEIHESTLETRTPNVEGKFSSNGEWAQNNRIINGLISLRGFCTFVVYAINTVFWCSVLFIAAFLKLIIPLAIWRKVWTIILIVIAFSWIRVNNFSMKYLARTKITVDGLEALKPKDWYLVLSNHQSWVDILVLQNVFYRKIPFLKFFLKKELIWVPFLGIAWWALDFPFMKRYSKAFLAKHPHLRGKDIEITRKACEKFKTVPVSVMNFVEGTRFSATKHQQQQSPFQHLLKPKAGGVSQVLGALGQYINYIVNVTIVYNNPDISFWDYLCGKIDEITVKITTTPINRDILGDYANDDNYRREFQEWLNTLWQEKDRLIHEIKS